MAYLSTDSEYSSQRTEIFATELDELDEFEDYIIDWMQRAWSDDELSLIDVSPSWLYPVDEVIDEVMVLYPSRRDYCTLTHIWHIMRF